jgi:hypothetical protein
MSFVEQARRRVQELMERVKTRRVLGSGTMLRGTQGQIIGGQLGGGKVIQKVSESIDRLVATAKEKRPNIIPTVIERIKTYEPGKRIKELVPITAAPPSPPPAPTPAPEYRKILRD